MESTRSSYGRPRLIFAFLLATWGFLNVSADLKYAIDPHIHWFSTAAITFFYLLFSRNIKVCLTARSAFGLVFVFGMTFASLFGSDPVHGVAQALKLLVVLFLGDFLVNSRQDGGVLAFKGILFATVVNAVMLLLGALSIAPVAELKAPTRWGTILCWPGSLWRVGMVGLVFSIYLAIKGPHGAKRLTYVVLFACSSAVILADGSRTAGLLLGLVVLYLGVLVFKERPRLLVPAAVAAACVLAGTMLLKHDGLPIPNLSRTVQFIQGFPHNLAETDPTRYLMVRQALRQIASHPLVGSGMGNTTYASMDIHMSYLEIWANAGLLAFLGYAGLMITPLVEAPRLLRHLRNASDPYIRAVGYTAVFTLFSLAVSGLFHPFSTEWSEWTPYLVACSLMRYAFVLSGEDEVHPNWGVSGGR